MVDLMPIVYHDFDEARTLRRLHAFRLGRYSEFAEAFLQFSCIFHCKNRKQIKSAAPKSLKGSFAYAKLNMCIKGDICTYQ